MIATLKNKFNGFLKDTAGNASIEAVIVFPALMVIFAASWVYFDVMRQQSISQKANYTIGDMISRETDALDDTYINNARKLLFHLTKAQGNDVDLRVTVIQYDQNANSHEVVWAERRGNWSVLSDANLTEYADRIPAMADADQLILVETRDAYVPTFNIAGIGPFDIETYSFTRPRFAPQVIFEGVNDGSNFVGGGGNEETPDTPS
jgi:Flp pilus assembly protein TadG